MPASVKLQAEYGDAMQVIFVESQGATESKMEGFALRRKWLGTEAMWTTERPCDAGLGGLPSYVLLSADGRVLEKGHHTNSQTMALLEEEMKSGSKGPVDTPKPLQAAWKSFHKGQVADALEVAAKVRAKGEFAAAADAAAERFQRLTDARLDRIEWCIENGYVLDAEAELAGIRAGVAGLDDLAARAADLAARLSSPEMKEEREACKTLERILERIHEDGFGKKEKNRTSLEKIAKQYDTTRAGARARHLLEI